MSRNSVMVALAAAVSLGAVALSSSEASAFRFVGLAGGGHVSSHLSGPVRLASPMHPSSNLRLSGHIPLVGPVHPSSNLHLKNYLAYTKKPILGIVINPHHHHHDWWWWRWRAGWQRPYWIAPVVATGAVATGTVASYASTPVATHRCNCLTKEYTPQGAVLFKDLCTNEMAMNPPTDMSPAADMTPQQPQQPIQQGYLQPPAQPTQAQ